MGSIMLHAKHFLNTMINLSRITRLRPQFIRQRPFMSLFLGAFLATGFLPLLTYLLFACAVACVGVFILVVIEGVIIAMATVTLLVFLIVPACFASGLSVFAYTVYVSLSHMQLLLTPVVNVQQKRFSGEGLRKKCDEKPSFDGNICFRRARTSSDVSGDDSVCQDFDVEGKKLISCLEASATTNKGNF